MYRTPVVYKKIERENRNSKGNLTEPEKSANPRQITHPLIRMTMASFGIAGT